MDDDKSIKINDLLTEISEKNIDKRLEFGFALLQQDKDSTE